ncbi:MAG TPA: twin-arginine translocase TatA/TatE family subunit [Actinomycetota bacterium]|nr:twin-arginine translocase TatA/TatE family subunit [Actinomycetota bacterium]
MNFGPEWLVVLGIIVLLFGAKKLPELARSIGRSSAEFKKGLKEGQVEDAPGQEAPRSTTPSETAPPEASE